MPASEHTVRAGTRCPSAAKPGSEPSNEVSAAIWRPGLKSNKDILLLRKCWGWWCPVLWAWPREKANCRVFGPDQQTLCKSHSGHPKTGKSQTKCSPREAPTKLPGVAEAAPHTWILAPQGGENRGPFRFLGTTNLGTFIQRWVPRGHRYLRHQDCLLRILDHSLFIS